MLELLVVLDLLVVGWVLSWSARGVDDAWRTALALPLGVAVYVLSVLPLLVVGTPAAPALPALALANLLALARVLRTPVALRPPSIPIGLAALGVVGGVVALTRLVPLVNVTADSFAYLTVAGLLERGDVASASPFLLESRVLATGALHALAPGEPYLRSITPLLAVATAALLWLLVREGVGARPDAPWWPWAAAGAVALLATNHRFVFNAFYVNGHLMIAVWVLVLAAVVWRTDRAPGSFSVGDAGLAATMASAITVTRPEGLLLALVVLLPTALDPRASVAGRRVLLAGTAATSLLWHGGVVGLAWADADRSIPTSTTGLTVLAGGLVLWAIALPLVDRATPRRALLVVHLGAWLGLAALTVRDPSILYDSATATARNVLWEGRWGSSLLLLAALLVIGFALRRPAGERPLVFVLTTSVPFLLLLALLREGAYRVGPGDSLNRMLLHFFPVALLALALLVDAPPRRRTGQQPPPGEGRSGIEVSTTST